MIKKGYFLGILIVSIVLSVIIYFPIINSFFLSDDFTWIYQIQTQGIFGVWTTAPDVFFRPIISILLFLDYQIWGLNPVGYHLTNIIFHGICSFFVYLISSQLLVHSHFSKKTSQSISIIAGFLFLVLPSHVEAVTWISARSDVVATCFFLAAFNSYLYYKHNSNKFWLLSSYVWFIFALLSKESVIIYPGLILGYEIYQFFQNKKPLKQLYKVMILPILMASIFPIYLGMRYLGLKQLLGGYGSQTHLNFSVPIILRGLASSLRIIIPPLPQSGEVQWQWCFLIFISLVTIFVIQYFRLGGIYREQAKLLLFLIYAFLISMFPVINIRVSLGDTQAERILYLPSVFFVILLVFIISFLVKKKHTIIFLAVIFSIFLIKNIYIANKNWQIASQISHQLIKSINDQRGNQPGLLIINVPDNFKGAYIYRNGIYHAAQLFSIHNIKIKFLNIASFHNLLSPENQLKVAEIEPYTYQIQLVGEGIYFMNVSLPLEQTFKRKKFTIENFNFKTHQSYQIKIKNNIPIEQIFYYSQGQLLPVPHRKLSSTFTNG
ncbi:hypothetical protein [Planktothrix sp. FACHB-1365]|uniref:hypothetical protein n=1 Tax=Planktothrix sp. FACHB-1365 TaxID=2692855 RepID=UPI00168911CE|nr:hypothetical protein [Planktothrix sp. FACHB-1365]MBD2482742.1 hypothetical protein [Planktothrix sp. FACHB-1365]